MLPRFSIIVCTDAKNGIGKAGTIPWYNKEDSLFFRDTTKTLPMKNFVIMGRKTYESLPEKFRPLPDRTNVVISKTMQQKDFQNIIVHPSLLDALSGVANMNREGNRIFIIGGASLYEEAIKDFIYLVDKIYVTKLRSIHTCDTFFPFSQIEHYPLFQDVVKSRDFDRYIFSPNVNHQEFAYLELLHKIIEKGEFNEDRTGDGTFNLHGESISFDMSTRVPFLTTKEMFIRGIKEEFLMLWKGLTDTKVHLEDKGINIWKAHTSREFLDKCGLNYPEGQMGPAYGFQLRHWNGDYLLPSKKESIPSCEESIPSDESPNEEIHLSEEIPSTEPVVESNPGVDQLQNLVNNIRKDPYSRRHLISYWNPSVLNKVPLPPCHFAASFHISNVNGRKMMDCVVYQRSADCFLGVPFDIGLYTFFTYALCSLTDCHPRKLTLHLGDAHIYKSHIEKAKLQLLRTPLPFATLNIHINGGIDDLHENNITISNYRSWSKISAKITV